MLISTSARVKAWGTIATPVATCMNTGGAFTCTCPVNLIDVNGNGTLCAGYAIGGYGVGPYGRGPRAAKQWRRRSESSQQDGGFAFATTVTNGSSYDVTISGQPVDQFCFLTMGQGSVSGIDVSGINVTCADLFVDGLPFPKPR